MALHINMSRFMRSFKNKNRHLIPFGGSSIGSIDRCKSSSSKSKNISYNDLKTSVNRESLTNNSVIVDYQANSSWENLDDCEYSNFAERYGEGTEREPENRNNIDIVSASDVLKDLMTEKAFGKSIVENNHLDNAWLKSSQDNLVNQNSRYTKNSKSLPFNSKPLVQNTTQSSYPFVENHDHSKLNNKTKIFLKNKKILVRTKKIDDVGTKNVIHPISPSVDIKNSSSQGIGSVKLESVPRSPSSKSIYVAFEEMESKSRVESEKVKCTKTMKENSEKIIGYRKNCLGLQMLAPALHDQIFGNIPPKSPKEADEDYIRSKMHLEEQLIWGQKTSEMPQFDLNIPSLKNADLEKHFYLIAEEQCAPYKELLNTLVGINIPDQPSYWEYTPGWTRYNSDGTVTPVDYPHCRALVFDVEVCVTEGSHPTLAVALSDKYWYSWCSDHLISNRYPSGEVSVEDLIPLESSLESFTKGTEKLNSVERIVVGHNVSYDRLRVSEQYHLSGSALRFVDTMSLHIAVSGFVSEQRAMMLKNKTSETKLILPWMSVGSQNSLNDVYKFYCRVKEGLKKDQRNVFVKGSISDVRNDFQNLMFYCANDVQATFNVLNKLMPIFFERFPHPVTFSGMLEMGSTILPVTENWTTYTAAAERKYRSLERLLNEELVKQSQEALVYRENDKYKRDPWLWDLDWSVPKGRVKKLPGYPNWYRKLCSRTGEREGTPEPENMTTSLQIVPKILRLMWDGFPLHYERMYGWGYLKPLYDNISQIETYTRNGHDELQTSDVEANIKVQFPVDVLYDICKSGDQNTEKLNLDDVTDSRKKRRPESPETEDDWLLLLSEMNSLEDTNNKSVEKKISRDKNIEEKPVDIGIPGVAFIPLPHKNGPGNRVGNPLAKDYLNKIEDGTLSSYFGNIAKLVLKTNKVISYWKNNRDRILSQTVVWNNNTNDSSKSGNENGCKTGIILPMVVSAGTITRRAVERTWMTASNAFPDRIGSELKSMVEAPPGYKFVGADVDSQELWIAAVLGDAYFSSEHGSTALGWMTLQGKKSDGTDMHSRTAEMAGISRDQAKIINYGRIYGAGMRFVQRLLKQFNHNMSDGEAQQRALSLFEATKGKKGWILNERGEELACEINFPYTGDAMSRKEIKKMLKQAYQKNISAAFGEVVEGSSIWVGGSESHMFNCLEAIARSPMPKTPVLGAQMTRALEPQYVDDQFMTSRVNWVVQSSAVDYLHLMLVCMKWLFNKYNINGRFCISIHDEVRYLVSSEDSYRAALALQITNLLTRSLFAIRLGFKDLPQSVAFFSSVDIDRVMRKEPHLDCVTPSNPEGLFKGYGIPPGESLDIEKILKITKGNLGKQILDHEPTDSEL